MDGPPQVEGEQVRLDAEQEDGLRGRRGFADDPCERGLLVRRFFAVGDEAVEGRPADREVDEETRQAASGEAASPR
jgi:hypothetical protein